MKGEGGALLPPSPPSATCPTLPHLTHRFDINTQRIARLEQLIREGPPSGSKVPMAYGLPANGDHAARAVELATNGKGRVPTANGTHAANGAAASGAAGGTSNGGLQAAPARRGKAARALDPLSPLVQLKERQLAILKRIAALGKQVKQQQGTQTAAAAAPTQTTPVTATSAAGAPADAAAPANCSAAAAASKPAASKKEKKPANGTDAPAPAKPAGKKEKGQVEKAQAQQAQGKSKTATSKPVAATAAAGPTGPQGQVVRSASSTAVHAMAAAGSGAARPGGVAPAQGLHWRTLQLDPEQVGGRWRKELPP